MDVGKPAPGIYPTKANLGALKKEKRSIQKEYRKLDPTDKQAVEDLIQRTQALKAKSQADTLFRQGATGSEKGQSKGLLSAFTKSNPPKLRRSVEFTQFANRMLGMLDVEKNEPNAKRAQVTSAQEAAAVVMTDDSDSDSDSDYEQSADGEFLNGPKEVETRDQDNSALTGDSDSLGMRDPPSNDLQKNIVVEEAQALLSLPATEQMKYIRNLEEEITAFSKNTSQTRKAIETASQSIKHRLNVLDAALHLPGSLTSEQQKFQGKYKPLYKSLNIAYINTHVKNYVEKLHEIVVEEAQALLSLSPAEQMKDMKILQKEIIVFSKKRLQPRTDFDIASQRIKHKLNVLDAALHVQRSSENGKFQKKYKQVSKVLMKVYIDKLGDL